MKFIWFFIPLLLISGEVFYDKNISNYSLSKTYNKNDISYTEELSYIDTNKTFINNYQKYFIKNFQNTNPKNQVKEMINNQIFSQNFYNKTNISIFSSTKHTITLKTINNSYFGGAHGSYNVEFTNFYNKQIITLKSITKNYKELLRIAKQHYKFIHLMKQSIPLISDGWFNNKFILPQNFAITNRGILFYYNSYEIKAYAFGHTKFILPYYKIKNILNLKIQPSNIIILKNEYGKITIINKKRQIKIKIQNYDYVQKEKLYIKIYHKKHIIKTYKNLNYDSIKTITINKPKKEILIDIKVKFDKHQMPENEDSIPVYNTKKGLVYRISIL